MHKKFGRVAKIAAAAAGMALIAAPSAYAGAYDDNGDGSPDCNVGEICLADTLHSPLQNHYYYASEHNKVFYDTAELHYTNIPLRNNAGAIYNRDTKCTVTVYDSTWNWDDADTVRQGAFRPLNDSVREQNDYHTRC